MNKAIKKLKQGFTLVELMIVVAIVGVLAVLAIYGVRKYIANSKTTEARNGLGQIAKDAATAFSKDSSNPAAMAIGTSTSFIYSLCDSTTPVPSAGVPSATKYQSQPSDWGAGGTEAVGANAYHWQCLGFYVESPQYYEYTYVATQLTSDGATYTATARGDLNGDTVLSTFQIYGSVQKSTLASSPTIFENSPLE
jgi:type IV pilus assembly protein PilA